MYRFKNYLIVLLLTVVFSQISDAQVVRYWRNCFDIGDVYSFAMDSTGIVYVLHGNSIEVEKDLYRSTDLGVSWELLGTSPGDRYLTVNNGKFYTVYDRIYCSQDGIQWDTLAFPEDDYMRLAVTPGGYIWAVADSANEHRVYASFDGGNSAQLMHIGEFRDMEVMDSLKIGILVNYYRFIYSDSTGTSFDTLSGNFGFWTSAGSANGIFVLFYQDLNGVPNFYYTTNSGNSWVDGGVWGGECHFLEPTTRYFYMMNYVNFQHLWSLNYYVDLIPGREGKYTSTFLGYFHYLSRSRPRTYNDTYFVHNRLELLRSPALEVEIGDFDFFPLHPENVWHFLDRRHTGYNYQDYLTEVTDSMTVDGHKYYYLSNFDGLFYRYDRDNQILYYYQDTVKVYMDFSANKHDYVRRNIPFSNDTQAPPHDRITENHYGRDREVFYFRTGYQMTPGGHSMGSDIECFADGVGFYNLDYESFPNPRQRIIIEYKIMTDDGWDIYESPYVPEFNSVSAHHNQTLNTLSVNSVIFHHYNSIAFNSNEVRHYYVDSVWLELIYIHGSDSIAAPIVNLHPDPYTINYNIEIDLLDSLLNRGYKFGFRIGAKDRNMNPHIVYWPQNGYQVIVPPPPAPLPFQPANNAVDVTTDVNFVWTYPYDKSKVSADKYRFELSDDSLFGSYIYIDASLTDTTITVSDLNYMTDYFWRLKAKLNGNWSNFSTTYKFTTMVEPVNAPDNLIAFANLAGEVILEWDDNAANEEGFIIERKDGDTTSSSSFAVLDSVGADVPTFTDTSVPDSIAEYTYRILAYNTYTVSPYSNQATVTTLTAVGEGSIPDEYALRQNYPNPFNPITIIAFDLPEASDVVLTVYDILGSEVHVIANEHLAAGRYTREFNAAELPSGIYFYSLKAGEFYAVNKMLLIK